jgi:photosystem II stability/assembly factor-like uncharacterized protein
MAKKFTVSFLVVFILTLQIFGQNQLIPVEQMMKATDIRYNFTSTNHSAANQSQVYSTNYSDISTWSSNGPFGGLVFSFDIDHENNIIYAGTRNGVWKSKDNGQTWSLSLAPNNVCWGWAMINSIKVLNDQQKTVLALCSEGLFKSVDNGETWLLINESGFVGCISTGIYAGGNILYMAVHGGGIMKSSDNGITWDSITPQGEYSPSGPIEVYPEDGQTIIAGMNSNGIYKSVDGGLNWNQLSNGVPIDLSPVVIKLNPLNPNTVYAGFRKIFPDQTGVPGLYKSYNGGQSWQQLNIDYNFDDNIYEFDMIDVNPSDTNSIIIACTDVLYKSLDGGNTFSANYSDQIVGCITVMFNEPIPGEIYLGKYTEISKSTDGGNSFLRSDYGLLGTSPSKPAISGNDQSVIYTSTDFAYRSNNSGGEWNRTDNGLPESGKLYTHPGNNDIVYCVTYSGVYKSENSGLMWDLQCENEFYTYYINPENPTERFAASSNILYKSNDGGDTWSELSSISGGPMGDGTIVSLAFDSQRPERIFCGVQVFWSVDLFGATYKSDDYGITWTQVKDVTGNALAIDSNNPDIIYMGSCENGLFKSIDGGDSWEQLTNGLGNNETLPYITDIIIDSKDHDHLYVSLSNNFYSHGINNNGIFQSFDGGQSWSELPSEGLIWKDVTNISMTPDGSKLFASVECAGVFTCDLNVGINNIEPPSDAFTISPNPASDNFEIAFNALNESLIEVDLYDIAGRFISRIYTGTVNSGEEHIFLNRSQVNSKLSPGVYILKLNSNQQQVGSQKLIIK